MDGGVFIIVVLSILAGTFIVCLPIFLIFWAAVRKKDRKRARGNEEVRLRRIWEGLQRMEERIDNVETIVGDRRRRSETASVGGGYRDEY